MIAASLLLSLLADKAAEWKFVGGSHANTTTRSSPFDASFNASVPLNSLSGGIDTGVLPGDLLVVIFAFYYGTDQTISTPSGWNAFVADYLVSNVPHNAYLQLGVFYKVATAADTSVTITSTAPRNTSIGWCAAAQVWRVDGLTSNDPMGANSSWYNTETAITEPSINVTGGGNQLAICFAATCASSAPVLTVPSGMENLVQAQQGSTGVALCSTVLPVAGNFAPAPFGGGGSPLAWMAGTCAFKPT